MNLAIHDRQEARSYLYLRLSIRQRAIYIALLSRCRPHSGQGNYDMIFWWSRRALPRKGFCTHQTITPELVKKAANTLAGGISDQTKAGA